MPSSRRISFRLFAVFSLFDVSVYTFKRRLNPSASLTLSTSPEWEADIQLPFSTVTNLPKNKFFDKLSRVFIGTPGCFYPVMVYDVKNDA